MCHFSTDLYTTDLGISLLSWWLQRPGRPDKLYYRYLRRQVCAVVGFWKAKFKYWSVWVGCLYMRSLTGPCRLVCRWSACRGKEFVYLFRPMYELNVPGGLSLVEMIGELLYVHWPFSWSPGRHQHNVFKRFGTTVHEYSCVCFLVQEFHAKLCHDGWNRTAHGIAEPQSIDLAKKDKVSCGAKKFDIFREVSDATLTLVRWWRVLSTSNLSLVMSRVSSMGTLVNNVATSWDLNISSSSMWTSARYLARGWELTTWCYFANDGS